MNYTEVELLVREATNEDPWGPTGPQMKEIAHLSYQYVSTHTDNRYTGYIAGMTTSTKS